MLELLLNCKASTFSIKIYNSYNKFYAFLLWPVSWLAKTQPTYDYEALVVVLLLTFSGVKVAMFLFFFANSYMKLVPVLGCYGGNKSKSFFFFTSCYYDTQLFGNYVLSFCFTCFLQNCGSLIELIYWSFFAYLNFKS